MSLATHSEHPGRVSFLVGRGWDGWEVRRRLSCIPCSLAHRGAGAPLKHSGGRWKPYTPAALVGSHTACCDFLLFLSHRAPLRTSSTEQRGLQGRAGGCVVGGPGAVRTHLTGPGNSGHALHQMIGLSNSFLFNKTLDEGLGQGAGGLDSCISWYCVYNRSLVNISEWPHQFLETFRITGLDSISIIIYTQEIKLEKAVVF